MTTSDMRKKLPYLFRTKGKDTKFDPNKVISDMPCPSCQATKQWKINSTRTVGEDKDIKRHAICTKCGQWSIFLEREIEGVPKIMIAPDDRDEALLKRIDELTTKLKNLGPDLKLVEDIREVIEPGARSMSDDAILETIREAKNVAGGDETAWQPVRDALNGMMDESQSVTPDLIAEAITARIGAMSESLKRSMADNKESHNAKVEAVRVSLDRLKVIESIGGEFAGDEPGWKFPFYHADGTRTMLAPEAWIERRKKAAKQLDGVQDKIVTDKIVKPISAKKSKADKKAADAKRKREQRAKKKAAK